MFLCCAANATCATRSRGGRGRSRRPAVVPGLPRPDGAPRPTTRRTASPPCCTRASSSRSRPPRARGRGARRPRRRARGRGQRRVTAWQPVILLADDALTPAPRLLSFASSYDALSAGPAPARSPPAKIRAAPAGAARARGVWGDFVRAAVRAGRGRRAAPLGRRARGARGVRRDGAARRRPARLPRGRPMPRALTLDLRDVMCTSRARQAHGRLRAGRGRGRQARGRAGRRAAALGGAARRLSAGSANPAIDRGACVPVLLARHALVRVGLRGRLGLRARLPRARLHAAARAPRRAPQPPHAGDGETRGRDS